VPALSAAIYCRISSDPDGLRAGVIRQESDCRELVESRGWATFGVYVDNDASAYSGRPRPEYQRLLEDIRAGVVSALVAWHPDRLHRSPAELEEFIGLADSHGVEIATVQAGNWDLSSPQGRLVARSLGAVARYESEHKSARVVRALEQNATAGQPHGRHAFGWNRLSAAGGVPEEEVNDAEAAVVRRIIDGVLAGDSLRGIAGQLNHEGVASPAGGLWTKGSVRHIAMRERNAGLRTHRGKVVGPGTWPPLIDEVTHHQVLAVLKDPGRRTSTGSAAAHLLSGIARCGRCGGPIRATVNRTTLSYKCAENACVSRKRSVVDALVTSAVLQRLAQPNVAALARGPRQDQAEDHLAEAERLRQRLDEAAMAYAEGIIDLRQMQLISNELRPLSEAAELRAQHVEQSRLFGGLPSEPDAVAAAWESWSLTRRRAMVDALVTVRLHRTAQGARVFDPKSVEIAWRND
jgi:site-specific DNA recombinase